SSENWSTRRSGGGGGPVGQPRERRLWRCSEGNPAIRGNPTPPNQTPKAPVLTDRGLLPRAAPVRRDRGSHVARRAPMASDLEEFRAYRERMNERILGCGHLGIKRFFNLDTAAYRDGALDASTKELLGLVASLVLRCNDCVDYHLVQCVDVGLSDEE